MDLLTVRAAARLLHVHENTVGRYEKRGLLRAIRLPSGVRRFEPAEVEALAALRSPRADDESNRAQIEAALERADALALDDSEVLALFDHQEAEGWDEPTFPGHEVRAQQDWERLAPPTRD